MPGIGKTTSVHCLAHQLLGDAYKEGVLELNASDERYVRIIHISVLYLRPSVSLEGSTLFGTKLKHLHKRRSRSHQEDTRLSSSMKPTGNQLCCLLHGYRHWFMNSMTPGAQQALRRTMEIYSNTTRFALACNMSNKIIEPIQSRCAILRYAKLRDAEILKRLLEICELEKVIPDPSSPNMTIRLRSCYLL